MNNYKIPQDQFYPWWPNLCVLSTELCGANVVLAARSARVANNAIKKMMEQMR